VVLPRVLPLPVASHGKASLRIKPFSRKNSSKANRATQLARIFEPLDNRGFLGRIFPDGGVSIVAPAFSHRILRHEGRIKEFFQNTAIRVIRDRSVEEMKNAAKIPTAARINLFFQ